MSSVLRSSRASARSVATALMIVLAGAMLVAAPGAADARLGGGGSFGSRGSRTFSMPAPTPLAPRVSPFSGTRQPGFGTSSIGRPGFFGGGFGRGLLGGFLGAGLFGLLFGNGFGGGLGGGLSIIGLLLQLGLLYLGFRFVMGFFRRSSAYGGSGFGGGAGFGGVGLDGARTAFSGAPLGAARRPQGSPIEIGPQDYQTFERRLVESQAAYSNGDVATLRRIATPQMAGNFEQELAGNARQGVVNKLADVRLLSGDLSEAWREGADEYATVAMRFSLVDATLEERTGRVVAGNPNVAQEVTEVWTFARRAGSGPADWTLSAIQQA